MRPVDSHRAQHITLMVAVLGFMGLWYFNADLLVPPEEQAELARLKNVGLAQLESADYEASARTFANIAARLPEDRLGTQNLVISQLLALKQGATGERAASIREARATLGELDALVSGDVVTAVLRSRLEILDGNPAAATQALRQATESPQASAALWYELYTVARDVPDQVEIAHEAIGRAAVLAPDNLAVQTDWLLVQVQAKDPTLVDNLENTMGLLEPFSESIRHFAQVELETLIAEAASAARSGDWPNAERKIRALTNVLRPEIGVRLDRKRLLRHELELVVTDFTAERMQNLPTPSPEPGIAVRFLALPALPQLDAISDFLLLDFDLDGDLDVALVRAGALETYLQNDGHWTPGVSLAIAVPVTHVIAADFDRDTGQSPGVCETADLDLVVFGPGGARVVENRVTNGDHRLHLIGQDKRFESMKEVSAASVIDIDHDGDLDLALASSGGISLWSNNGDWQFTDISYRSALPPDDVKASALVTVDWNRTIDLDLMLGSADSPLGFMENHRHGRLRWRELGTGFEALNRSQAIVISDFDGNVSWDVAGRRSERVGGRVVTNPGAGVGVGGGFHALVRRAVERRHRLGLRQRRRP